jgi:hypothetical protein
MRNGVSHKKKTKCFRIFAECSILLDDCVRVRVRVVYGLESYSYSCCILGRYGRTTRPPVYICNPTHP